VPNSETNRPMIEKYLNELSRFPHRMSGTRQDSQAADWIRDVFKTLGLETSAQRLFVPGRLAFGIALNIMACFAAFFFVNRPLALSFAAYGISLFSLWGELTFSFHFLRRIIPPHRSCNVEAAIAAGNGLKKTVVIMAHHDTPGTGLLYRGEVAGRVAPHLRNIPAPLGRIYFPPFLGALGLGLAVALRPLAWTRPISAVLTGLSAFLLCAVLFLVVQWGLSRPSTGANDNGSGILVLLELAERFSKRPAGNIAVSLLATGAEEAGFFGVKAFLKNHRETAGSDLFFINLDGVGGGELHWAIGEETLQRIPYPQTGLDLLSDVERKSGLAVLSRVPIAAPTDAGPVARMGFPVLTLIGLENGTIPPHFHQASDTFDRLDLRTLIRAADIVEQLVRHCG